MKFKFTLHALDQMARRGIPKALVKEALEKSNRRVSSYDDVKCHYKKGERELVVIYRDTIVITAYWLDTR